MSARAAATGASGRRTPSQAAGAGATLRVVLFDPRRGFPAAVGSRTEARGATSALLAALGGASTMLLWLKLGALAGRGASVGEFRWGYLVASLAAGAVAGVIAQRLWSMALPRLVRSQAVALGPPRLRTLWGLASLPHALSMLVLLPVDSVVAGPAAFTTGRLTGPLPTIWTAISIAAGVSLACWSVYLFIVGTGSTGTRRGPAIGVAVVAWIAVVAAFVGAGIVVSQVA